MLATVDVVGTATVVAKAVEDMAGPHPVRCHVRHQKVGACKDLEGHIFTIRSGNKSKGGDMLRTSVEKMATYIGTKFGNDAAQEWTSGTQTVLPEPA